MDGGIDDLVPEGSCHLETLKLNMGRYLMKGNRGEHMLGRPPLEKEMHGRKERERQSEQRVKATVEGPACNCPVDYSAV